MCYTESIRRGGSPGEIRQAGHSGRARQRGTITSDTLSFRTPCLRPTIRHRQGKGAGSGRGGPSGAVPSSAPPAERKAMGGPNNALRAYMKRPDRIRSVLEYYLREDLPVDWECRQRDGFLPMRDRKGRLTFRERDYLGEARAWGVRFLLGIENQQTVNLTYPWRLMEMDCPGIVMDNSLLW